MDEGVSWFSTGVYNASPQENTVVALALVHHATSTGSEQLLKEHMTDIMTGSVDYTPDGLWRTSFHDAPRGGRLHLVCGRPRCSPRSWPREADPQSQ